MPDHRLHYEEIPEGLNWETPGITVTEAHVLAFAGLTGDFYDLHVDDDYARSLGYPTKVAHGLLGLALADGLKNRSSVQLAAIVSLGWRWSFTGPILPGDRISATIRVTARRETKRPERGIVTLDLDLRNQRGETVQRGENDMMVHRRPG
ncbi:MaoC family dehydratase [Roseomonas populi]|uniref:MaoC/PaaZ C-terminal domain-containing protein n=1 Tax=Roseomonas populi TaxID=3121582 RepID=A0ABT1X3J7_9PROT|nr:MaoC/PaaZ C-terminal domain-containing protein [Roseomonas pecuniae]MCR0982676.1 MaoC/PaaZ C-terminal domain-containing protein [Roseomonas pecuniae]